MSDRLIWERDGVDWPHAAASRFVDAGGLRWHVQTMGAGPPALLLHGTGASTHSWRALAPMLAERFTVIMPDLPGHGFTGPAPPGGMTLPGMARAVSALLAPMDIKPELCVGHSAGAAILIRMALDGGIAPKLIVSINGALMPFRGASSKIFSPMAKLLFMNPFVPRIFAWQASAGAAVDRLIEGTGSKLDAEGVAYYARLFRSPGHVAGALGMMANWDLQPLIDDLPNLQTPLVLIAGGADRAVPPDDAFKLAKMAPRARVEYMPGLGHLAHEENPRAVADVILRNLEISL
jgi:magnesium chelatase accessory protein